MKLESGRRVYVPATKTFGTIVRQGGILGLRESYAIVDDVGSKTVFVGDKIDFVYVDTSTTLSGEKITIPPDVVPEVKKQYSPPEATKLVTDLYKTSLDDREKACQQLKTACESISKPKKASSKSKKTPPPYEDKRPVTRISRRKSAPK